MKKAGRSTPAVDVAKEVIPKDQESFDQYNANYKCPEYHQHDDYSFYDIENDMQSSRLEQPSAL